MRMYQCTLVVPAFNEAARIGRCLTSVIESELPAGCSWREIVILDDASTDETVNEVKKWGSSGDHMSATVVSNAHRKGKAGSLGSFHRSMLAAGRNGELVVVCDADVIVLAGSMKSLLEPFVTDESVGVVWGSDIPDDCSWGRWASSFQMVASPALVRAYRSSAPIAFGWFFAYRVGSLQHFAWRSESGADDSQICEFVSRNGVAFRVVPTAAVGVTPAGNYRDFYLQTYRWFAAQGQFRAIPESESTRIGNQLSRRVSGIVRRWYVFGLSVTEHPMWAIAYVIARVVALVHHKIRPEIDSNQWRQSTSTKGVPT